MNVFLKGMTGTWREVADAARTTVNMEAGTGRPSDTWIRRMLLSEHSPIRKIQFAWKWYDLLWWVQTHFTRHKIGVEFWVSTSREDRTGVKRSTLTQNAPVNVEAVANIQALINISRKRLCYGNPSKETREAWEAVIAAIGIIEPQVAAVCVPDCIYRGWCYEYKSCNYHLTDAFRNKLNDYRSEINGWDSTKKR